MGHTLTCLLVFAKDEKRAYDYGKEVYDQLCKKGNLWHYHLMGTVDNGDNPQHVTEGYPKVILFSSPEGQKLIRKQLSGMREPFLNNIKELKSLLNQTKPETLWTKGGDHINILCDHCSTSHKEWADLFYLCEKISNSTEFVYELYAHPWGKIRNGYAYTSFLEEYVAAKDGIATEYNKEFVKAVTARKQLWIVPAYTKT